MPSEESCGFSALFGNFMRIPVMLKRKTSKVVTLRDVRLQGRDRAVAAPPPPKKVSWQDIARESILAI